MPVDVDGPRVEVAGLLAANAPIRLAYVVPTYHNPTGATMPEARGGSSRRSAAEFDFQVVEDLTPDTSLGLDVPPPIAAFDQGDRVITLGSLSKLALGRPADRLDPGATRRRRPPGRRARSSLTMRRA